MTTKAEAEPPLSVSVGVSPDGSGRCGFLASADHEEASYHGCGLALDSVSLPSKSLELQRLIVAEQFSKICSVGYIL